MVSKTVLELKKQEIPVETSAATDIKNMAQDHQGVSLQTVGLEPDENKFVLLGHHLFSLLTTLKNCILH